MVRGRVPLDIWLDRIQTPTKSRLQRGHKAGVPASKRDNCANVLLTTPYTNAIRAIAAEDERSA